MKIRVSIIFLVLLCVLTFMSEIQPASGATDSPSKIIKPSAANVNIEASSSVYVDEAMKTSNFNVLGEQYLLVGTDEFGYISQSFIQFKPIAQSSGGLLPDNAKITSAKIRLYKEEGASGTVDIYRLKSGFYEGKVTWDTKPDVYKTGSLPSIIASESLPGAAGWYDITLPVSLVEEWVSSPAANHGIAVYPKWTDASKYMRFRSDEAAGKSPMLVIYYTGAPTVTPTPTPIPDNIPCELSYTITPENPRAGEPVTITLRATDNQALSHVTIMRGTIELARKAVTGANQKTLEVSYEEAAVMPSMNYTLIADDIGEPLPVRRDINIPVTGSGSAPVLNVTLDWLEVEEVIPERFRLIEGDGQMLAISITATDPDGIKLLTVMMNGTLRDFHYDGDTNVRRDLTFVNNDRDLSRFSLSVSVQDRENRTSSFEKNYDIAKMEDLRMMWSSAMPFKNAGSSRLSWERMVQVFGEEECWWVEDWGWKNPKALSFYHSVFKDIAKGGCCFGFGTLANELYRGRLSPSDLEKHHANYQLGWNNSYTREYIEARQAGQLGREVVMEDVDQYFESDDFGIHHSILPQIERDLQRDDPGNISIHEGDSGHIIVPWMVRHMTDGTTRVYVYDCNKVSGVHNADGDLNNSDQFPFMEMDSVGWEYQFNSTRTWNDRLFYHSYDAAIGNSNLNRLGDAADAPLITDQTIPTIFDAIGAFLCGDADMYIEDEQGRAAGIKDGTLREEIPGAMLIRPAAGEYTDSEMIIVPDNIKFFTHITGNGEGEYSLGIFSEESTYGIEEKKIKTGDTDRLDVEPFDQTLLHRMTLISGASDDDFIIRMSTELDGQVKALGKDVIGREFIMEHTGVQKGSKLSFGIGKQKDRMMTKSETGGVIFDVIMRSTESADAADESQSAPPGSKRARLASEGKRTMVLTPENWATDEDDGEIIIVEEDTAPDLISASDWAVPEIERAIENNLTVDSILNNFRNNITRQEFCEISVKLYEKLTGKTAVPVSPNPFTDTNNAEILKAYNLGIVKGVSADRFAPELSISRQEICVMLLRALKASRPSRDYSVTGRVDFIDKDSIAAWAMEAVEYMNRSGIMKGVGGNRIDPLGNTTREQAIALVLRTYDAFK